MSFSGEVDRMWSALSIWIVVESVGNARLGRGRPAIKNGRVKIDFGIEMGLEIGETVCVDV